MWRKNTFKVVVDGPLDRAIKGAPEDTSEGAFKHALSDLHIDVKKVHLRLHLRVNLRLHLKVSFYGVLEGELVSATEDAFEGTSEGAPKTVFRDLYKDVPESYKFISREYISENLPMAASEM